MHTDKKDFSEGNFLLHENSPFLIGRVEHVWPTKQLKGEQHEYTHGKLEECSLHSKVWKKGTL